MATFAKSTFNAAKYSAARPTYPKQLFDYIFEFHRNGNSASGATPAGQWERAVDLGCGTGQATQELRAFREAIGVDPSDVMLEKARSFVKDTEQTRYRFVQGSAEDLSSAIPAANSVDLAVAAQAAHWFNWGKVWPEVERILRPGGTAAFWVYTEFRLSRYPTLTPKITEYAQGKDELTSLGPYFQRPGRTILERHLVDVPEPSEVFERTSLSKIDWVFFCGNERPDFLPQDGKKLSTIMNMEMRWRDLLSYFRTWSSLHNYHARFPEDLKREADSRFYAEDLQQNPDSDSDLVEEVGGGDIAVRFWKDLREGALVLDPSTPVGINDLVAVEWPIALLLVRKTA